MPRALRRRVFFAFAGLLLAAPATALRAEPVCVTSAYEVAWVHPGVTMFLDDAEGRCTGESLTLKEGEHGCFSADVALDGGHHLSALDATSGRCRAVCPITRSHIELRFDQSRAYACAVARDG